MILALGFGAVPGDRSVAGTASLRAGEDVFPLMEIVPEAQGATAFPPPSVDWDGLRGLPALPLPPIEEDRDAGGVSEPTRKGTVQLVLVPRHNQVAQHRRTGVWPLEATRADWHRFPLWSTMPTTVREDRQGKPPPSRAERANARSALLSQTPLAAAAPRP
jgi:hypothetical protein